MAAENVGSGMRYFRQTIPRLRVEMIQRARAYFDQDFVSFDFRIGDFGELEPPQIRRVERR